MSAPPKPAARWSLGLSHGAGTALLVSGLVIINHALFIYAQASGANCAIADDFTTARVPQCSAMGQIPLGGVFEIAAGVDVDYTARGLLATALSALESKECGTSCPEGSATRQDPATLGVCDALRCEMCTSIGAAAAQHCNLAYEVILEHWTYLRSVEFMWKYKGPHHGAPTHPAKPLAAAIFVWSFVWPHLKLLLIHAFFYLPLTKRGRTTGNYWLAVFGECAPRAARARPSAARAPPDLRRQVDVDGRACHVRDVRHVQAAHGRDARAAVDHVRARFRRRMRRHLRQRHQRLRPLAGLAPARDRRRRVRSERARGVVDQLYAAVHSSRRGD